MHQFKEGEVAIIKWQGKDCLVFIHRASFQYGTDSNWKHEFADTENIALHNEEEKARYGSFSNFQTGGDNATSKEFKYSATLSMSSPVIIQEDSIARGLSFEVCTQKDLSSLISLNPFNEITPIYWISFPGYRNSVASSFRWWTVESNLTKLIFDVNKGVLLTKSCLFDPIAPRISYWNYNSSSFENIDSRENNLLSCAASQSMQDYRNNELWAIPSTLQIKLAEQVNNAVRGKFAAVPKLKRLNIDSVVETFKKTIYAGAKLIEETEKYSNFQGYSHCSKRVDPTVVPPFKRFMKMFPALIAEKISYTDYVKNYVDNLPWIDLWIAWFNRFFLISGVHSKEESKYILDCLKAHPDMQLSQIMGIEHLVQCLQSQVIGKLWLDHINIMHHEIFASFKIITLLFLQFIAAVYNDFSGNQRYDEIL